MSEITSILLCGGKGERLKPWTESAPKPLVPLNGRPLLGHLIDLLCRSGVRRHILCTGYKSHMVDEFVAAEYGETPSIACVDSGDATMTERLRDAWPRVAGRALICYGDTLANVNLAALEREHSASGALATVTLCALRSPFGIVEFDGQRRVTSFREKPALPYWINIGFLLCEPGVLSYLERAADMPEFLDSLAADRKLFAYVHQGKHLTINTEKERLQAESEISGFITVLDNWSLT